MRKVRGPLAAFVVFACFLGGLSACSLPRLQDYHARPLAQTSFLYAADGSLITSLHATEDRVALTSAQMTQNIRDAVVAIEDRRFYSHHGVDPEAILRAAVNDLRKRSRRRGWFDDHASNS
jgi:penicillin-binding protein 1A